MESSSSAQSHGVLLQPVGSSKYFPPFVNFSYIPQPGNHSSLYDIGGMWIGRPERAATLRPQPSFPATRSSAGVRRERRVRREAIHSAVRATRGRPNGREGWEWAEELEFLDMTVEEGPADAQAVVEEGDAEVEDILSVNEGWHDVHTNDLHRPAGAGVGAGAGTRVPRGGARAGDGGAVKRSTSGGEGWLGEGRSGGADGVPAGGQRGSEGGRAVEGAGEQPVDAAWSKFGWWLLSDDATLNPDMWGWNHVLVPYCSQDLHSGQVSWCCMLVVGLLVRCGTAPVNMCMRGGAQWWGWLRQGGLGLHFRLKGGGQRLGRGPSPQPALEVLRWKVQHWGPGLTLGDAWRGAMGRRWVVAISLRGDESTEADA
jgi:hypothetical protein